MHCNARFSNVGIQENSQRTTGESKPAADKPDGSQWVEPLVMSNQSTIDVFEETVKRNQEHLSDKATKRLIGKFNMAPDKISIFYWKRDDGELVVGAPPTMYRSCLQGTRAWEITRTTSDYDRVVRYGRQPWYWRPIWSVEGVKWSWRSRWDIYVGANPSIHIKVNDAIVVDMMERCRRLLSAPRWPKVECVLAASVEEEDGISRTAYSCSAKGNRRRRTKTLRPRLYV